MTATHVNGIEVISDEPIPAPIKLANGESIYWQQTRTLTLADGTVVYGCVHCDWTIDAAGKVCSHLRKHAAPKTDCKAPSGELSLNQLVKKLTDFDAVVEDRDRWKKRAMLAEERLRTLRDALGGAA